VLEGLRATVDVEEPKSAALIKLFEGMAKNWSG
jgi:hypothetical protein